MSQSAATVVLVPAGTAALAAKQQRLADLEGDLVRFELAKIATGAILKEIRDEALFLVSGGPGSRAYADFAGYCADRWGIGEREVARRIEAAENVQKLVDAGVDPLQAPRNPWQARELAVLINATDVQTGVATWRRALTDSQDPKKNPAGQMTGEFLKAYVTAALHDAGKQRRAGTPRARPGSVNTGNQTPAPVRTVTINGQAVATNGAAPSSQPSLQVAAPTVGDVSVLASLAADVKARRLQTANPLARRPLFGGLVLLLEALEGAIVKPAALSPEGQALQAALLRLADRIAEKAS